jgi:small subunit ribosomal protein S17
MERKTLTKKRIGTVVSHRMDKTAVVWVERRVMHPKYKKYLKLRTKLKAHDGKNECRTGDRVLIVECRPLSREKHWRVSRILERAAASEESASQESSPAA